MAIYALGNRIRQNACDLEVGSAVGLLSRRFVCNDVPGCQFFLTFTTVDNVGLNDPSPATLTIIVQPAVQITNPKSGSTVKGSIDQRKSQRYSWRPEHLYVYG
jgi:hypothetical protein